VKADATVTHVSRGFDAGRKINGRKRHLLTDTLGLLLAVRVTPASMTDRDVAWGAVNERRIRCQVAREPPPRSPPQNFSWTAKPSLVAPPLFRNQPASSQDRVK
jgi:hypothetical protein